MGSAAPARDLTPGERRIRVLRVIARLNMGGPAHHVSILSGRLDPSRYETLLAHGDVGPGEASMEAAADRQGARRVRIPGLGPELRPLADLRALAALARLVRRFRPDIVHTHTAKAGLLGRLAALSVRPRPVVVHTYHGHVLEGYFGPSVSALYRFMERRLGRVSDRLVGVSQATVEDLVRLRVAPRAKFRAVPLGLELDRFARPDPDAGAALRRELGVQPGEVLVTYVGRLVPIKRVDLLLRAAALARRDGAPLMLAVVGDGPLRQALERLAAKLGLGDAARFLGYRDDMPAVAAATDIAALASANEGTPVFLIEAAAAGRPAVATDVGGVHEVVTPETGMVVPPGDEARLAEALGAIAGEPERRRAMGARARDHALARYGAERLLADIDALYAGPLEERRMPRAS